MKKFVFIRHGLSTSNRDRIISGNLDVPLSVEGREGLKELKRKGVYPKTDIYISSPLMRCLDTFSIIHETEVLHNINPLFEEIYYGNIQGTSPDEKYLDEYFIRLFSNDKITENELYADFTSRIEKGIIEIYESLEENDLDSATIICHSTVIKSIIHKIKNFPLSEIKHVKVKNGLGIKINIEIINGEIIYSNLEEIG